MIQVRKSSERGHANHGWLDSYHTFSFADYHDPKFMGFRQLRVINEDRVSPGEGFGAHPHKDMEIISYVLEGSLEHKDSLGNGSVMKCGDIQVMSAGTGVKHSEFNHSRQEAVHFLQIWILPSKKDLKPSYQQKNFSEVNKKGKLCLVASPGPQNGALKIHQDVHIYASVLSAQDKAEYALKTGRHAWIQITSGAVEVNGVVLEEGDGAAVSDEKKLTLTSQKRTEFLLFDLA